MDQLAAQVLVAALADSEQLWLAAGGRLPRNETKPRSEIAPTLEAFRPPDGGDELCLNVGDGLNQAADISWFATSILSWNFTPRTTFGN